MDSRTRPSHAALHEKVFRHDDPIWEQIYPPNGFNCRCRVRTVSQARLETEGLTVDDSSGQLQEEMAWAGVDKRTGEAYQQPVTVWRGKDARGQDAVFRTDPGFSGNQGQLGLWDHAGRLPDYSEGAVPKGGAISPVDGQPTWRDYGLPSIQDLPASSWRPTPELLPRAKDFDSSLDAILGVVGLADKTTHTIQTPAGPHVLHRNQFVHIARSGGGRERLAPLILPLLTRPHEIWGVDYGDHMRMVYLGLYTDRRNRPVLAATRENVDGSFWLWTVMEKDRKRLIKLDEQRLGVLLWPRP